MFTFVFDTIPHHHDDPECHPVVEAAVLDGDGHDETSEEHVVGGVEVVDGHVASRHHTQQRKTNLN